MQEVNFGGRTMDIDSGYHQGAWKEVWITGWAIGRNASTTIFGFIHNSVVGQETLRLRQQKSGESKGEVMWYK